jgi:2-dehydro-3-deoxygluconokinase
MIVDMSTRTSEWQEARSILALGEPLIELSFDADGIPGVSFGGDVANILICLSKLCDTRIHKLRLITSLGGSTYSKWLRANIERHGIEMIEPARAGEPGIYGISPDSVVQPFSSYWRSGSAAREFFSGLSRSELVELALSPDIVVISGITLALCSDRSFEELLTWVRELATRARVAFDCNFRPALWASAEQAKQRIERFKRIASLIVTSLEDEDALWPHCQLKDVLERLTGAAPEVVLRAGSRGCWVYSEGSWREAMTAAIKVVDSTGAGDSHLAAYIAARMNGGLPLEAARFANAVARVIITQRGSIPRDGTVFPALPNPRFDGLSTPQAPDPGRDTAT